MASSAYLAGRAGQGRVRVVAAQVKFWRGGGLQQLRLWPERVVVSRQRGKSTSPSAVQLVLPGLTAAQKHEHTGYRRGVHLVPSNSMACTSQLHPPDPPKGEKGRLLTPFPSSPPVAAACLALALLLDLGILGHLVSIGLAACRFADNKAGGGNHCYTAFLRSKVGSFPVQVLRGWHSGRDALPPPPAPDFSFLGSRAHESSQRVQEMNSSFRSSEVRRLPFLFPGPAHLTAWPPSSASGTSQTPCSPRAAAARTSPQTAGRGGRRGGQAGREGGEDYRAKRTCLCTECYACH